VWVWVWVRVNSLLDACHGWVARLMPARSHVARPPARGLREFRAKRARQLAALEGPPIPEHRKANYSVMMEEVRGAVDEQGVHQ
jgi:hypothetical protein